MKIAHFLLVLALQLSSFSFLAQIPTVSNGTIKRFENFTSKYVQPRTIDVWLPDNYSTEKKYSVLYMQDGQMLFDSSLTWNKQAWEVDATMQRLIAQRKIKDCIVVGVWNGGAARHTEYFPQKPFEALPKTTQDSLLAEKRPNGQIVFSGSVQSDNYLKFLVTELKPFIDSSFSTKKGRKDTFIAGSSMGGLISWYAVCEYPMVFGGAACISTHWTGIFRLENNPIPSSFLAYLDKKLPSVRRNKFYFDYGTATLDALYPTIQAKVDVLMKRHRYSKKNWQTKAFVGEDHSERAWRKRFHLPMEFLLRK